MADKFNDIAKNIEDVFDKNMSIGVLEKEILDALKSELIKNINVSGGKVVGFEKSVGSIISTAIKNFANNPVYEKSITNVLKNVGKISDEKLNIYKQSNLNVNKSDISDAQKIVIQEYLDNLNEGGLNNTFNQSLRTLIYDNIKLGVSQDELEKILKNKIVSGEVPSEISKYLKQSTLQASDAYSKIVDNEIYKKYKQEITGFRIIGSIIDNSSSQCKEAVNKYDRYLTKDEMKLFLKKYEGKTIEGTTIDNVSLRGLHWNCRHQVIPVIKNN